MSNSDASPPPPDQAPDRRSSDGKVGRLALAALLVVVVVVSMAYAVRVLRRGPDRLTFDGQAREAAVSVEEFNLEGLQVPADRLVPGGPAKDGIRALVEPEVIPITEAEGLGVGERVVGLVVDGESRAYPVGILSAHEIVNDRLGGRDIAVIYCPLCDSASVVDRLLDGKTYEFGVSGLLYHANIVLYDRNDQALWSQVGLTALSGPNAGRSLKHLDGWELTTFGSWKERYPESTLITLADGPEGPLPPDPYGKGSPFGDYFEEASAVPGFSASALDPRLAARARVIGLKSGDQARAYPIGPLLESGRETIHDELGGAAVELAVDPDTGSVRVLAVPEGAQVVHTFWYAWAAFHPGTEVYMLSP